MVFIFFFFVQIRGLGIFKIREKNERIGRNPKTGVESVIKPRKVVTFKPSKILKDKVMGDHRASD